MIDPELVKLNIEINQCAEREQEIEWLQQFFRDGGFWWRMMEWIRRRLEAERNELLATRDRVRRKG